MNQQPIIPSRSREGNPYDHASCERFLKTLKREEIDATSYRDLEHWRANIEEFIERYDNRCRLHSALGYRTPEEIESSVQTETLSLGTTMSFFSAMRRSIDPMFRRSRRKPTSPAIVSMSLRLVIPWQVGLHPSLPPLYQPSTIFQKRRLFESECTV